MSPGPDDIPFAPDDAEPAGRPKLALLDEIVEIPREGPEPGVWALLDIGVVARSDPPRQYAKRTPSNVHYVLSRDSRWCGRVRANQFDGQLYLDGRTVQDRDLTEIVHWLERVYSLGADEDRVAKTLVVVGDEHPYHPIRDWLATLRWDGEPRAGRLLDYYLGVDINDEDGPTLALLEALGRCFLVSCVARVMQPGCKVDTTLILVGPQGAGKSTACKILANGWFSDTAIDLGTKDLYECLSGVWLYELAELDSFGRHDWSRIKAVLSSPTDRWRRPYGRSVQSRERQCVFVGTTNKDQFLGDSTGSRRFWPVRVGIVQGADLRRDVEQLWAEAVALYNEGVPWWLDAGQAAALEVASEAHHTAHPWTVPIAEWCLGKDEVTTAQVLAGPVAKDVGHWTRGDEMDVAAILRRLGYAPTRIGRQKIRGWRR